MTGTAEGIAWDRLSPDEHGPCKAVGCSVEEITTAVIIDGQRYPLCLEDAELIPGYTTDLTTSPERETTNA
ncbi:hypothetical protein SAMN05421874_128122 [Nonomuraea maritima]|uniref:Uncharacterized protein n=1 Tax=Nonomuraea maritima TaxID=683260 RepID=A0A1G9MPG7_9ACTN|nr:hypothetical protein SAMN05421874_128122 [Nonomuraea maritima]